MKLLISYYEIKYDYYSGAGTGVILNFENLMPKSIYKTNYSRREYYSLLA